MHQDAKEAGCYTENASNQKLSGALSYRNLETKIYSSGDYGQPVIGTVVKLYMSAI